MAHKMVHLRKTDLSKSPCCKICDIVDTVNLIMQEPMWPNFHYIADWSREVNVIGSCILLITVGQMSKSNSNAYKVLKIYYNK